MDDFFDRLDKYMSFKKLNDNQVTVKAGLSVGSLGKQRRGSRGLSNDSIAKILQTFRDLNPDWLILGTGDMLRADKVNVDIIKEPEMLIKKQCLGCHERDHIIEVQKTTLEARQIEINALRQALEDKERSSQGEIKALHQALGDKERLIQFLTNLPDNLNKQIG